MVLGCREDLGYLVVLEEVEVDLVDQTTQRGKKGVLVWVQGEALGLTADQLLQILLEGEMMHSQKGG